MAMLLIPFMALLITIVVVILAKHKSLRHLLHHPPGPRRLPFIGNLHQLQYGSSLHLCLSQLSNKYGPLMYMKLIHIPVIVISSAKVAKLALKHNDLAFSSRPSSIASAKLSYNNLDILSSSYTSYWREMRKIVFVHLFTHKQVRSFRPVRDDVVSHMINEISKRANLNQAINLSHIISSFSSSLIFRVAFGKRCDDETRFDEIINELQKMIIGIFVGDHFPSFSWIDKLTGMTDRLEKVFKDSDSFYQQLIDEHLSPNRPDSMNGDLVDILIQLRDQHASVDWDHIKAILMNVFAAGTETSAVSITWAMTALIKNPSALKKLQKEVRSLVRKKDKIDEDDIEKLPYLKAVVKETLRLYPPAPLSLPRETTQKSTITGYEIEPKTFVYVNLWAIGRDPEYWENPNEFLPERFWNGSNIDFKGQDFGLIPFGSGRRICPGMSLAIAAMEVAVANLAYSFDWELPNGMTQENIDTEALPGVIMHKKNALCLVPKIYVTRKH